MYAKALPKPRVPVYHERGDNLPFVIGSKRSRAGVIRTDIRGHVESRIVALRLCRRGLCLFLFFSLPVTAQILDREKRPWIRVERRKMTKSRNLARKKSSLLLQF